MAQLPCLVYEQRPPISSAEFRALARSQLSKSDAVLLDSVSINSLGSKATGCSFIDKWYKWERELRLNVAKHRSIKLKQTNAQIPEPSDYHMEIAATASKAVDEYSPLEGEIIIDKARWNAIENLAGSNYFHRSNVYAYMLKLLLIERRQAFNVEKGFAEYKSLYASIVESASESRGEFA